MEPVKGGSLMNLPDAASAVLTSANPEASLASWALRYAGSLPGTVTVLSGMSNLEQMRDNIATFKDFKPLTSVEQATVAKALIEMEKVPTIPCTACDYCREGCPENIAIPGIFDTMNNVSRYHELRGAKFDYTWETKGHNRAPASACIACGACEAVCPQQIPIIEELKRAAALFD
jgi:predicted aldo/keto reductase-like oxidoreductase